MTRSLLLVGALTVALVLLPACGSADAAAPAAPASLDGAELFSAPVIGSTPGCVTCHSLTPGHTLVGPSLGDLRERRNLPDDPALADHIRSAILEPGASPGNWSTPMPDAYGGLLSDDQIDAVVSYLVEVSS